MKIQYHGFNALCRRPMFWGMPFGPAIGLLGVSVFAGMIGFAVIGLSGALLVLLVIPTGIWLREICATDDHADIMFFLRVKWSILRVLAGDKQFNGGTFALLPNKYGRIKHDNARRAKAAIRR